MYVLCICMNEKNDTVILEHKTNLLYVAYSKLIWMQRLIESRISDMFKISNE